MRISPFRVVCFVVALLCAGVVAGSTPVSARAAGCPPEDQGWPSGQGGSGYPRTRLGPPVRRSVDRIRTTRGHR